MDNIWLCEEGILNDLRRENKKMWSHILNLQQQHDCSTEPNTKRTRARSFTDLTDQLRWKVPDFYDKEVEPMLTEEADPRPK